MCLSVCVGSAFVTDSLALLSKTENRLRSRNVPPVIYESVLKQEEVGFIFGVKLQFWTLNSLLTVCSLLTSSCANKLKINVSPITLTVLDIHG